jgi:plastocyanin
MRRTLPAIIAVIPLALAACGGGASPEPTSAGSEAPPSAAADACAPSTASGDVTASIVDFDFDPGTIQASVGDVVSWTNEGDAPHTATLSDHADCTTPRLASGESGGIQFSAPGSYAFFCEVHPNMTGTVEVSG